MLNEAQATAQRLTRLRTVCRGDTSELYREVLEVYYLYGQEPRHGELRLELGLCQVTIANAPFFEETRASNESISNDLNELQNRMIAQEKVLNQMKAQQDAIPPLTMEGKALLVCLVCLILWYSIL